MTRQVFKYQVPFQDGPFMVTMTPSPILCVGFQRGDGPVVWAEHDSDAADVRRLFRWFGTGHVLVDEEMTYIDTVPDGPFVWHLYEVKQ